MSANELGELKYRLALIPRSKSSGVHRVLIWLLYSTASTGLGYIYLLQPNRISPHILSKPSQYPEPIIFHHGTSRRCARSYRHRGKRRKHVGQDEI